MIRDNARSKAKVQARGLLGGQGLDYCQTRTDTIQATCHVQAYRNTYQHFSNRVKVKYFDRPIIRKPPVQQDLPNEATICAHDALLKGSLLRVIIIRMLESISLLRSGLGAGGQGSSARTAFCVHATPQPSRWSARIPHRKTRHPGS